MTNPNCSECIQIVDQIMREMLDRGGFSTDSAQRDSEMRKVRQTIIAEGSIGCCEHREGERVESYLAS